MKYLFIVPIIILLASCSKQSVSENDVTTNYIEVNGVKHLCNSISAGAIGGDAKNGYEVNYNK